MAPEKAERAHLVPEPAVVSVNARSGPQLADLRVHQHAADGDVACVPRAGGGDGDGLRLRRPCARTARRPSGTGARTASTARGQPSTRAAAPWRRTGFGLRHLGLRGRLLLRRGLLLGGRHGGGGCAGGGAAGSVVVVAIRPSGRRKPPRIGWMIADGANAGWVAAALLLAGTHTHLACASYYEGVRPSAAGERAG